MGLRHVLALALVGATSLAGCGRHDLRHDMQALCSAPDVVAHPGSAGTDWVHANIRNDQVLHNWDAMDRVSDPRLRGELVDRLAHEAGLTSCSLADRYRAQASAPAAP